MPKLHPNKPSMIAKENHGAVVIFTHILITVISAREMARLQTPFVIHLF
jgi:hypothetical protein